MGLRSNSESIPKKKKEWVTENQNLKLNASFPQHLQPKPKTERRQRFLFTHEGAGGEDGGGFLGGSCEEERALFDVERVSCGELWRDNAERRRAVESSGERWRT